MKWKSFLFCIIFPSVGTLAEHQIIDNVVAIVNNDIILKSDVDNLSRFIKQAKSYEGYKHKNSSIERHNILERLIMDRIIMQIGKKIGIEITDEQVYRVISDIAKENNVTINQMRNFLSHHGISYTFYSNQIRKDMIISKVRNIEVGHRVVILPQEVDLLAKKIEKQSDILNELNLSHIVIPIQKDPTFVQIFTEERKAHLIAELARHGKDFHKLVIDYSYDQLTLNSFRKKWINILDLPPVFYQELCTAKKGDIVGPIRFGECFYILKVNELRKKNKNVFMTEVNIRHIFMKPSSVMSDDQAREKLEKIAKDIKNEKITFSKAAEEFSQDFISSNNQGELGWIMLDICDPPLQNILMQLNKNQISPPVRSSFGWHLIELLDIRSRDISNLIKREFAYRMLFDQKFLEENIAWIQEQRANSYIKILRN